MSSPRDRSGSAGSKLYNSRLSEDARLEHITTECVGKAAHIILASRLTQHKAGNPNAHAFRANRWFNLETEELETLLPFLEGWKREGAACGIILEIFGRREGDAGAGADFPEGQEILLEMWNLELTRRGAGGAAESSHESSMSSSSSSGSGQLNKQHGRGSARMDTPVIYKRAVILLRSLFCFVRLLPTYSVFQVTKRSSSCKMSINYRIRSEPAGTRAMDDSFQDFSEQKFAPIETPLGRIAVSVSYVTNPVDALSKAYGASVMMMSALRPKKAQAEAVATPARRQQGFFSELPSDVSQSSGTGSGSGSQFAPHSAPSIRRQSWSFSRIQMQMEQANSRKRFSDVMVVGGPGEVHRPGSGSSQEGRDREDGMPRKNSSPVLIPNAPGRARAANAPWTSSAGSSTSGSYSSYMRTRMSPSTSGGQSSGHYRPFTAPSHMARGQQARAQLARTPKSSPEACVVGFSTSGPHAGAPTGTRQASGSAPKLPPSALSHGRLLEAPGMSSQLAVPSATPSPARSSHSQDMSRSGEGSQQIQAFSCSPQLPFAFTPRMSSSSLSYDFEAAPASGVPSIKLVRRSSISPKSSADMQSVSPSPHQDSFLDYGIPIAMPHAKIGHGSGHANMRITYPSGSNSGTYDDDDGEDVLPFALEGSSPGENAPALTGRAGRAEGKGMAEPSEDVAVGAFVRYLQEASPLKGGADPLASLQAAPGGGGGAVTVSSALRELKEMREALEAASAVQRSVPSVRSDV